PHAHPHPSAPLVPLRSEDLGDADLAAVVGRLLESDRPQRHHRGRMPDRREPRLDDAEARNPQSSLRLPLAHGEALTEAMLTGPAPERSGELPRLQVRDPDVAVEVRGPGRRVRIDPELEARCTDGVARSRALSGRPVRRVERPPELLVED